MGILLYLILHVIVLQQLECTEPACKYVKRTLSKCQTSVFKSLHVLNCQNFNRNLTTHFAKNLKLEHEDEQVRFVTILGDSESTLVYSV